MLHTEKQVVDVLVSYSKVLMSRLASVAKKNGKIVIEDSMSDVYDIFIREAGKNRKYASDIIIDINRIEKFVLNCKDVNNKIFAVGFRELGTDSLVCLRTVADGGFGKFSERYRRILLLCFDKEEDCGMYRITLREVLLKDIDNILGE